MNTRNGTQSQNHEPTRKSSTWLITRQTKLITEQSVSTHWLRTV